MKQLDNSHLKHHHLILGFELCPSPSSLPFALVFVKGFKHSREIQDMETVDGKLHLFQGQSNTTFHPSVASTKCYVKLDSCFMHDLYALIKFCRGYIYKNGKQWLQLPETVSLKRIEPCFKISSSNLELLLRQTKYWLFCDIARYQKWSKLAGLAADTHKKLKFPIFVLKIFSPQLKRVPNIATTTFSRFHNRLYHIHIKTFSLELTILWQYFDGQQFFLALL